MDYFVGQKAEISKTITETDVYNFAGVCGDFNPVHVNVSEAEKSIFKNRVAHGALVSSFISTVLGMYLPGPGTIYLSQKCDFLKPVYFNDTITAKVEICSIDIRGKARLRTQVYNQREEMVIDGEAIVKLPKKPNKIITKETE